MDSSSFRLLTVFLAVAVLVCEANVLRHEGTADPITDSGCGGKPADVLFVLDASRSIWGPDFRKQLKFVHSLGEEFDISSSRTRVGLMTFSDSSEEVFGFDTYADDKSAMLEAISRTRQTRGGTRTDDALLRMRDTFSLEARRDVPKVAIVMTDGASSAPESTRHEAKLAHKAGITVFAIGIGRNIEVSELHTIASRKDYVFTVDTFDALESIRDLLALRACAVQNIPEHESEETEDDEGSIQTPRTPVLQFEEEGHFEGGVIDDPRLDNRPGEGDEWDTEELLAKGCESKPADVVLALDASGSIWQPDFLKQLEFVQDLVGAFHINPRLTRIGVLTFGDEPRPEFYLDKYATETEVKEAISTISQSRGSTNTADAITMMTEQFFSSEQARDGVVRIGIVITDGKSQDPEKTVVAAQKAREANINLLAIGVGRKVVRSELESIANKPSEQFVWTVNNYRALSSLKDLLAVKACEVTAPPTTTAAPTTTTTEKPDLTCGAQRPADIVFSVPSNADVESTNYALGFFQEMTSKFTHVEDGGTNVALVPKECHSVEGFHLKETADKTATLKRFSSYRRFLPDNAQTLKYIRSTAFKKTNGAREDADRIAIMIVDGNSRLVADTAAESHKARAKKNINLFTVVVGKEVSKRELRALSGNDKGRVIRVKSYRQLNRIVEQLTAKIQDTCSRQQ